MKRRSFVKGALAGAGISVLDWLGWFQRNGVPGTPKSLGLASAAADAASAEPRFLIYWFLEGGWDSYSMFGPVATPNHAGLSIPQGTLYPSPAWSDQFYRPNGYPGATLYGTKTTGNITAGFLAEDGLELFPDLTVLSSHDGHPAHSSGRLLYHYGSYSLNGASPRASDERTVLQAFCERYGQPYPLAHVSWHRWLSDGELSEPNYPEGTGYYEKLGPSWAHTNYGRTPDDLRGRLQGLANAGTSARQARVRAFVDDLHQSFLSERNGDSVRAFSSAVQIHKALTGGGFASLDLRALFTDPALRAEFGISPADELTTSAEVNGNPARSKGSPNTNVQALMAYELMTKGLSCAFWIEARDVRAFDDHRSRASVRANGGVDNQRQRMNTELWSPLKALANRLKSTQLGATGKSYWDCTTIVLCSEMGRSMFGDVSDILSNGAAQSTQYADIMDQDVSQHWGVSSCAFLGGTVPGDRQFGRVGTQTLTGIPIEPSTGALDPAFDEVTGSPLPGRTKSPTSVVPNCGHLYATALHLSGFPTGANGKIAAAAGQSVGQNTAPPLTFVKG